MRRYSRRFQQILQRLEKNKLYNPLEAIELLQELSSVNFVETVETHVVLGLDPKYTDQQLRATVILPKGTGKHVKIAVIARNEKAEEAKAVNSYLVGSEDLINEIMQGRIDFDRLIVTPDMMPLVAKLGKILGPRGLMPSPKAGTVTTDIKGVVNEFKAGKLDYRIDRSGILHIPFGKLDFPKEDLNINLLAIRDSINKNRPVGVKGKYWKSIHLSSTMGPSLKIDMNGLV